jgi:hypothetical protein
MDPAIRERIETIHAERYGHLLPETVEAGRVRDYLAALDEPADLAPGAPVPLLFLLSFGRTRRPGGNKGGAVNAGDEYRFFAPVHVGDIIITSARLADIEERQGKRGPIYLATTEIEYRNQRSELVGTRRTGVLRWFD